MVKKNKLQNVGIIGFISFIVVLTIFSSFVFFNNSSNLEVSIRSNDQELKRKDAVTEALIRTLVNKNDTISVLDTNLKHLQKKNFVKDSVIVHQIMEITKLKHENDSILNVVKKLKWSDIEPVTNTMN